jgi:hypothetical protein
VAGVSVGPAGGAPACLVGPRSGPARRTRSCGTARPGGSRPAPSHGTRSAGNDSGTCRGSVAAAIAMWPYAWWQAGEWRGVSRPANATRQETRQWSLSPREQIGPNPDMGDTLAGGGASRKQSRTVLAYATPSPMSPAATMRSTRRSRAVSAPDLPSRRSDSNRRPALYKSAALPAELLRRRWRSLRAPTRSTGRRRLGRGFRARCSKRRPRVAAAARPGG